ncbi:serine hydroxymethyltransferase, partial [Patescibacteria group bacterium]|nr:serine hydroxymethyltransferase [Patescibacteria group bacterium]
HSPFNPSGIRLGTPAVTTRGMKEKDMQKIASWISQVISDPTSASRIKQEIKTFCKSYPLP